MRFLALASRDWGDERRLDIPWRKTVIDEVHVKGLTPRPLVGFREVSRE